MNDFPSPFPESVPPLDAPPPAAPVGPPPVTRDECTLGMLAHVLQIFSWLIGPAIIFLVRRDSKFVRYHALQALFFQLLVMMVWAASVLALIAGALAALAHRGHASMPAAVALPLLALILFWGGAALTWILNLVLGIVYGLRANNGEWAGYPGIKYLAARVAGVELE